MTILVRAKPKPGLFPLPQTVRAIERELTEILESDADFFETFKQRIAGVNVRAEAIRLVLAENERDRLLFCASQPAASLKGKINRLLPLWLVIPSHGNNRAFPV